MAANTIFILGDSTSMTIGCERHMYPFIMSDSACWPESTEIVNCSQPGFTSADSCAFFFRHWKEYPSLKAVVIHIGTCDATSWEIRKGRYSPMRQALNRMKEASGITRERTRLKNRLIPYEWNSTFDPEIELPEPPGDYEYNISRIIRACTSAYIPVVMVRPKANPLFLPGVGKANFIFYRYLGINDRHAKRITIPDSRFQEALYLQETGNPASAAEKYREILLNSGQLSFHSEYPLLVVNNYAVCAAENGDLEETESLLLLLLKERAARKEITLYNLAAIYRMRGDEEEYRRYLSESYEADSSMYRIRSPYLNVIDRVSDRFGTGVNVIDIASFIGDNLYVDHTHPLREGQEMIADRIAVCLNLKGFKGSATAAVKNILYNPELSLGNTTEFFTYYRTYAPFGEEDILRIMNQLRRALGLDDSPEMEKAVVNGLPKELRTALEYHLCHPCFPALGFLTHFGPRYPSDVGRFPEYFLVRHLIPYLRLYEKEPEFNDQFSTDILRKSQDLHAILPPDVLPLVQTEEPPFDPVLENLRLPAILTSCRQALLTHLRRGNQVYERIKTTIFWYFREILRYGSHSRISMRYERTFLENVAEALAVASILNLGLTANRGDEIKELIRYLEQTVRVHEDYGSRFTLADHSQNLLKEYDERLFEIADKLGKS